MAQLIRADSINFAEYERNTEAEHKVRAAADFFDDVRAKFVHRDSGKRSPSMFSTKAGGLIEFRPGEVTAWAGYNGHKKSMFVSQVVMDLCVQRERVLVASMEMSPAETLARMSRQASGTARPHEQWLSAFEAWTRGRLWIFDHIGRVSPEMCLGLCRYFSQELRGSHIVIDSMMMVCASEEHMDEQKQFVTDLVRIAQECGVHVHLVTHCRKPANGAGEEKPPTKYDIRGAAAISDQVANVITVWSDKRKAQRLEENPMNSEEAAKPDALVTVEKQRNGSWEGRMRLWFDQTSLRFCDDRISAVIPYQLQADACTRIN